MKNKYMRSNNKSNLYHDIIAISPEIQFSMKREKCFLHDDNLYMNNTYHRNCYPINISPNENILYRE